MGGWCTDWRTLIPQKSTHWSEGSEPHVRLPNLGVRQQEEEFLENQTLKPSRNWWQDFDRTVGNRDPTLGDTHKAVCTSGPRGRSSDPRGDWTRRTCWCWRVSYRGGMWLWLTVGMGTLAAEVLGGAPWREPPRVCHWPQQGAQVSSSVGLPQAKQPTGREPSPTHQQWSRLKFYWALPTKATVSSTHHQSLPSGNLHKPLR